MNHMKLLLYLIIINFLFFACKFEYEQFDEEKENFEDFNLTSTQCQASDKDIEDYLKQHNIEYNQKKDQNLRFILSPCSPIVLVPGIYSTKLKVKINCRDLKRHDKDLYKKIKFYCSKYVCSDELDRSENRYLWLNLGKDGFTLIRQKFEPKTNFADDDDDLNLEENIRETYDFDWDNRFAACLGFFMTIFNNETECPIIIGKRGEKRICGHSNNIQIRFLGGFYDDKKESECGVKPIENCAITDLGPAVTSKTKVFEVLVQKLEKIGYKKGFSLSGVPNDFRTFISTNKFGEESLVYHIQRMYKLTGKPVVIIAHSYGNLVTLNTLIKDNSVSNKIKKWIALAPPFASATKAVEYFMHGIKDFDSSNTPFDTRFELFGQYIMLKSIPTIYELKPFTIFQDLFNSENY